MIALEMLPIDSYDFPIHTIVNLRFSLTFRHRWYSFYSYLSGILYAISINFTDIRGRSDNKVTSLESPGDRWGGCQRRCCQHRRSPSKTNIGATRRAAGVDLREKNDELWKPYSHVVILAGSLLASVQPPSMPVPMPMRGTAASTGCSVYLPFPPCVASPLHYSVINSIYLRPVQRRVHPCRNLSVCRASLSPARLVANSRPFRNREEPSILITRAVVRRFKTPQHTIPPSRLSLTPPLPPYQPTSLFCFALSV